MMWTPLRTWTLALLLVATALSLAAAGQELELFGGQRFQGLPWRLRAEKVSYDAARRLYVAEGRVELSQGDRRLTAQRLELEEQTKVARLFGEVVLVSGEDVLSGKEGIVNLATQAGELKDARLFLRRNHFHLAAGVIRKTGEKTYYAEKARITTCDADRPAWSFEVRRVTVELEGYAATQGNVLRLAGVPVLYSPVAVLPVLTERQSGLLQPYIGRQRQAGWVVEVPFYWAMSPNADATFYQNYLSERGYQQGLEVRWRGHGGAALTFQGAYLSDGKEGVKTSNRYWLAGMATYPLGERFEARLTLDRVSDFNYLRDFNYGHLGLSGFSRDLATDFGRNLEGQEVQNRVSTGLVAGSLPWGSLTAYARYYQILNQNLPRPYNRLPGLALDTVRIPVGPWPLFVGLQGSYTHFYQERTQTGQKLELRPTLWWQAQPLPGVFWNSQVGLRETFFRMDQHAPGGVTGENLFRTLYDVKLSLAGLVYRDYGRGEGTSYYRHFLRPEITYWNMPRYQARRYPDFDPFDQGWVVNVTRNLPVREGDAPLGGVNALTYGFSSTLLSRRLNPDGQVRVEDIFWFRLTHGVFFTSSSMGMDGTDFKHHRLADFYAESEIYPLKHLALGFNVGFSPYSEGFNRANVKLVFYDKNRQNYLNVGYLYLKDFANQINVATHLNLLPSLKVSLKASHTFLTGKKLEKSYGVVLQRQCWGLAFSYATLPGDQRVGFSIILPGLLEKFQKAPIQVPEELRPH
ncbi:MAG: LPS assembly protein LptD [Desulfobaccales bacterium]